MKKNFIPILIGISLTASACQTSSEDSLMPPVSLEETISAQETDVLTDSTDIVENFQVDNSNIDTSIYLDYSEGIKQGVYRWILSDDGKYYCLAAVDKDGNPIETEQKAINVGANNQERKPEGVGNRPDGSENRMKGGFPDGPRDFGDMANSGKVFQGVYINGNITNLEIQTMLIYVPAEYMKTDSQGNVIGINPDAEIGDYTAETAPIVILNECGGWKSSSPRSCDTSFIEQGMIYVTTGARSRDALDEDGIATGKAPTQVVDLKSSVIELRANTDIIPGDTDRIISYGTSGGGQMSSIFGASGNMPEYYEYMYNSGVLGVTLNADGTYDSRYPDNIYAAQCYCPIADIENADLAYAWWWEDLADLGGVPRNGLTAFDKRLQELEAEAFVDYVNDLNLDGLQLDGLRSGTYYDAILANLSSALNAMVEAGEINPEVDYPNSSDWLYQNTDGKWQVTDMAGFMVGTGLVNNRNKAVPGFDTLDKSAENDAFGRHDESAVHYSQSVAKILLDNYDELSSLDGFNQEQVDNYITETLSSDSDYISNQTALMNATQIMLGANGLSPVDPAEHWRVRSGTADQHTSFSIGYNICLAAQSLGLDADYHLVWNMGHGSNEGTTTGTFIDWIKSITK